MSSLLGDSTPPKPPLDMGCRQRCQQHFKHPAHRRFQQTCEQVFRHGLISISGVGIDSTGVPTASAVVSSISGISIGIGIGGQHSIGMASAHRCATPQFRQIQTEWCRITRLGG